MDVEEQRQDASRRRGRGCVNGIRPGILVISHGSRESGWVKQVDEAVREVKALLPESLPIEAAYLELVEGRLIQDGIDRLEAAGVTDLLAIPLFISSGSTHVNEIGWALGAYAEPALDTDLTRFRIRQAALTYGQPIGADPEITEVLVERLAGLSTVPERECLLLIGHGSEHEGFYEGWQREMQALAAAVRTRGGYADAEAATLRPDTMAAAVRRLRERRPDHAVLAAPLFVSEGYFTGEVIRKRLDGLDCRYDGRTLLPHPLVAHWIARQIRAWLKVQRLEG